MSLKLISETLRGLGLTERDLEVFIFLSKKGPCSARDILTVFKINKAQLYRSLKSLQGKGMVQSTLEYPARFSAVSFDKALNLLIEAKKNEAFKVEENKDVILSNWKSLSIEETPMLSEKFMVIEGENYTYSKIGLMAKEAKKQILVSTNGQGLLTAEKANLVDNLLDLKTPCKILTNLSAKNVSVIENAARKMIGQTSKCEIRHVDLAEKLFPKFVMIDEKELIFFVASPDENTLGQKSFTGLWTNSKALIDSFKTLFDQLWNSGLNVERRVKEIRTGQSPSETLIIRDGAAAHEKFLSLIRSAQKEVFLMTSLFGMKRLLAGKSLLKDLMDRRVVVRVLAPITGETERYDRQLSKYLSLRYVQVNYLRSVIVDGREFLSFKAASQNKGSDEPLTCFDNSLYTNDPEYVQGQRELLEDLWNNSPSILENLKRSEARFRSLFENSFDAVLLTIPDGTILMANPAAQRMFNMTEEELTKAGRSGILVMDNKAEEAIRERRETGKSRAELALKRKDGTIFKGEATSTLFVDYDGETKSSMVIRDVTESKRIERELLQFSAAIKASCDGILIGDNEGYITYVNEAVLKMSKGLRRENFIGKYVNDFLAEEEKIRAEEISQQFMRDGQGSTAVYRAKRSDGSVIPIEVTTTFVKDENDNKVGFVDIIRDISTRQEAKA